MHFHDEINKNDFIIYVKVSHFPIQRLVLMKPLNSGNFRTEFSAKAIYDSKYDFIAVAASRKYSI